MRRGRRQTGSSTTAAGETGLGDSPSGLGFNACIRQRRGPPDLHVKGVRNISPCRIKRRYLCKPGPSDKLPLSLSHTAETRTNEGGRPAKLNNDGELHPHQKKKKTFSYFFVGLLCMPGGGGPPGHLHGQTDTATSKKGVWLQTRASQQLI